MDAWLTHALALNPRYAEAWIERALRNENPPHRRCRPRLPQRRAYRSYVQTRLGSGKLYLRQNDIGQFWSYARKCLEVVEPRRLEPASYNPAPVFDLAWRVTQNPAEIRARMIPHRHFILADYLEYLRAHNRMDAGADLAMELAAFGEPGDTFDLLDFCEQLINAPDGERAVHLWNAMVDHRLLPSKRLNPLRGVPCPTQI